MAPLGNNPMFMVGGEVRWYNRSIYIYSPNVCNICDLTMTTSLTSPSPPPPLSY